MSDVELMTTNGHSHYHEEEEEEPVGERNCRSPTEGTYGDDEMKENEEERKTTKRRVKKTVSIGGVDDSDDEKPRSRAKARTLSGRTMSSSEDESKPRKKVSLSKMSVRERQMSFEHPPDRVEHRPPRRNSRHGSTTASDVDDYHHQTAADRRNRWEKQASKDILGERRGSKAKVHGGSTG